MSICIVNFEEVDRVHEECYKQKQLVRSSYKVPRSTIVKIPYFREQLAKGNYASDVENGLITFPTIAQSVRAFKYIVMLVENPTNDVPKYIIDEVCDSASFYGMELDYIRCRNGKHEVAPLHNFYEQHGLSFDKLFETFSNYHKNIILDLMNNYNAFISGGFVVNTVLPFKNGKPEDLDIYLRSDYAKKFFDNYGSCFQQNSKAYSKGPFMYKGNDFADYIADVVETKDENNKIQIIFHTCSSPQEVVSLFDIDLCRKFALYERKDNTLTVYSEIPFSWDKINVRMKVNLKQYERVKKYIERGFEFRSADFGEFVHRNEWPSSKQICVNFNTLKRYVEMLTGK